MKKIYLKPLAEFEEIEESLLYVPSWESQNAATEEKGKVEGPTTGTEVGDNPEGGFDW